MSNIRVIGPDNPSDPNAVVRKKEIWTKNESDNRYVQKVNGEVPPATTTTKGGIKLSNASSYDSTNMYTDYCRISGTADDPGAYGMIPLWKAYGEWSDQLFYADDNGSGGNIWTVREDALDPPIRAKLDRKQRWSTEILVASETTLRDNGWNEGIGGVMADESVTVESVTIRVPDPTLNIGGNGNLMIDFYVGAANSTGSVGWTATIPAGSNVVHYTLPTPSGLPKFSVVRAFLNKFQTTGYGLQIQYRGYYN